MSSLINIFVYDIKFVHHLVYFESSLSSTGGSMCDGVLFDLSSRKILLLFVGGLYPTLGRGNSFTLTGVSSLCMMKKSTLHNTQLNYKHRKYHSVLLILWRIKIAWGTVLKPRKEHRLEASSLSSLRLFISSWGGWQVASCVSPGTGPNRFCPDFPTLQTVNN